MQCSAGAKITAGLASQWPCVRLRYIHLQAKQPKEGKGNEHPTYTPVKSTVPFTFTLISDETSKPDQNMMILITENQ